MTQPRPTFSVPRSLGALALCAVSLTGCLRTLETEGNLQKYGAIVVTGTPTVTDGASASSTGVFFEAFSATAPNSSLQSNSCQITPVDTTTREPIGQLQAGNSLTMAYGTGLNSRTAIMPFEQQKGRYASLGGTPYSAGDSVEITIPGATGGFPAAVIRIRLAEPLAVQPVTVPPVGEPMSIRWNASTDSTTAIYISLKYANPATSPYANEHILCSLRDDGTEEIVANALQSFQASPASLRSLTLTRWRTTTVNPADQTLLHIVSTLAVPVPLR